MQNSMSSIRARLSAALTDRYYLERQLGEPGFLQFGIIERGALQVGAFEMAVF